jgi:PKD repeat protein
VASLVGDTYEGPNPLTVNFTAASSTDPDAIDSVASYTFDCGDGTPKVTQSSPTLTHTYTQSGRFLAKLTVTDSRGLVSSNTSEQFIKVLDPVVDGLNPDKPVVGLAKGRFGGGSLDWLLVGVLVGLGALRRR